MTDRQLAEYQSCCAGALETAKIHDCVYYVYPFNGGYQATPTLIESQEPAAKVYPGGRILAYALVAKRPGP